MPKVTALLPTGGSQPSMTILEKQITAPPAVRNTAVNHTAELLSWAQERQELKPGSISLTFLAYPATTRSWDQPPTNTKVADQAFPVTVPTPR